MKNFLNSLWGIYSIWLRNAMVYRKTWLVNCLPPISEPIVYLVAFGYGLTPLIGKVTYHGTEVNYLSFIAPGMVAVGVMFQAYFEGAYGTFVRIHFQRTWQSRLAAPLTFNDVFLGDWLWAATRGIIAGVITGLVAVVWGIYPLSSLISSLPVIILGSLLFAAFGLFTAGLVRTIDQINVPVFILIVPMFALCGTYFPRSVLPPALDFVASILPLAAFVDLLRFYLVPQPSLIWSVVWLLMWTGVLFIISRRRIYRKLFK